DPMEVSLGLARLSARLCRLLADPRRGDGLLSLSLHQCRRAWLRQDVPQHGRACARVLRAWPRADRHRSPHGPQQQQGESLGRGNLTRGRDRTCVNLLVSLAREGDVGGSMGGRDCPCHYKNMARKELESIAEDDHRRRKAERTESPSVTRTQALMPSGAGQAGAEDRS